ncbi:hypothetical protein [Bradyrhizobium liaoningense]|uniref:hypothetical protein n=1 Tax=Bradyrhizobium liaoningense TaxID=43992 RepID=UPI001BAD1775|nr:hypothetical protein [Bradyrhizobium liaoningense]MBR0986537.1 hypothetical protein [Bradyrhizobium liaoningense]
MNATLSPSVHEAMVKRHMSGDDDPAMLALHDAVKLAREMATKAAQTADVVLRNTLETAPQRHRKARAASFELIERATKALDDAVKTAQKEIATIRTRTKGPPPCKDLLTETRQRELRERLAMLPDDRRKAIIADAIRNGDDLLVGAILNSPPWLTALGESETALVRHNWAIKHFAGDLDRAERLQKALVDAERAGTLSISFVDGLTDAQLIQQAETTERRAAEALAAAGKS